MPGSGSNICLRINTCTLRYKGGEGSGHRGHVGRPGSRGGSLPGIGTSFSSISGKYAPGELERSFGKGFTEEHLKNMFSLPGARAEITIETYWSGFLHVTCRWYDRESGNSIGTCERDYVIEQGGTRVAKHVKMQFEKDYMNLGNAKLLYRQQIATLRNQGFDRVEVYADITIGKYAWAKEGYQYADPERGVIAKKGLNIWLERVTGTGLTDSEEVMLGNYPTPRAFAEFDRFETIVTTQSLVERGIHCAPDISESIEMRLGKAFMLTGHGSWAGILKLQE